MEYFTIYPPGFMDPRQNNYVENNGHQKNGQMLAMAYVPMQPWQNLYEYDKGIIRGTVFEDLDLPFKGADMR